MEDLLAALSTLGVPHDFDQLNFLQDHYLAKASEEVGCLGVLSHP